jgi:hypothetical protein
MAAYYWEGPSATVRKIKTHRKKPQENKNRGGSPIGQPGPHQPPRIILVIRASQGRISLAFQ